MRAIGAGAGLSAVGGTAAARTPTADHVRQQTGEEGGTGDEDGDGTAHEVRTLISGPPTAEGRPADFYYQPTGLHVEPGDVLNFVFETPDHNVVAMHPAYGMRRRVPLGVDAFSSPLLGWRPDSIPGDAVEPPAEGGDGGGEGDEGGEGGDDGPEPDTWLVRLDTPGVYDLICSPHEGFGMAMRVVVGEETATAFETTDPDALPEPRVGPVGLSRVTLTDPALRPEAVVEAGRVEWGDLEAVQSGGSDGAGDGGRGTEDGAGDDEGSGSGADDGGDSGGGGN